MIAIMLDQRDQKLLGRRAGLRGCPGTVRESRPSRCCRRCCCSATVPSLATIARVRILVEHPFRRGGDQFGDDDFDAVLRRQVHHPVVVAPVILAGGDFDGRPHEPMAERVHPDPRCGLVIASPVLFRRIRLPEVDRSVGKTGGAILGASAANVRLASKSEAKTLLCTRNFLLSEIELQPL